MMQWVELGSAVHARDTTGDYAIGKRYGFKTTYASKQTMQFAVKMCTQILFSSHFFIIEAPTINLTVLHCIHSCQLTTFFPVISRNHAYSGTPPKMSAPLKRLSEWARHNSALLRSMHVVAPCLSYINTYMETNRVRVMGATKARTQVCTHI